MAKGTQRLKRLAMLEALDEVDPAWAEQIRALRSSNPQAYRKECVKADIMLAAKTGRPTSVSMRPKRFGGDEDPALVRRVVELRKHQQSKERAIVLPQSQWIQDNVDDEASDEDLGAFGKAARERLARQEGPVRGGEPSPRSEEPDYGTRAGKWVQDHSPDYDGDAPPADGQAIRGIAPRYDGDDIRPEGNRIRGRAPQAEAEDIRPEGNRSRGRAPRHEGGDVNAEGNRVKGRSPLDGPALSVGGGSTAPAPDLDFLSGTVGDARKALETGDYDAHLDAVEAAERAGKGRKGVLKAIDARR